MFGGLSKQAETSAIFQRQRRQRQREKDTGNVFPETCFQKPREMSLQSVLIEGLTLGGCSTSSDDDNAPRVLEENAESDESLPTRRRLQMDIPVRSTEHLAEDSDLSRLPAFQHQVSSKCEATQLAAAAATPTASAAEARLSSSPLFPQCQWHPRSQSKPHIHG